jgi:hypothetical protein
LQGRQPAAFLLPPWITHAIRLCSRVRFYSAVRRHWKWRWFFFSDCPSTSQVCEGFGLPQGPSPGLGPSPGPRGTIRLSTERKMNITKQVHGVSGGSWPPNVSKAPTLCPASDRIRCIPQLRLAPNSKWFGLGD